MPDISLCTNKQCPLVENCKRANLIPSRMQSYTHFVYDHIFGCDYYIPIQDFNKSTLNQDKKD